MKRTLPIAAALALTAGLGYAQFKVPQQQQPAPAAPPAPAGSLKSPQAIQQAQQTLDKVRRISRDEAIKLAKANKAIYVDVRSKEQYDLGHIKGAVSIPGSQLITRLRELPPGKMIVTYCA